MGCEMTIPKCKLFSPLLNIATLGLALFATLLQTIAFATHGWAAWTEFKTEGIGGSISVKNYIGLWYSVICKTGKCETISHLDAYLKDLADGNKFRGKDR